MRRNALRKVCKLLRWLRINLNIVLSQKWLVVLLAAVFSDFHEAIKIPTNPANSFSRF